MVVGFIQAGSESGWRAANTSSFKETAVEKGITLKLFDSQHKLDSQISDFMTFTADPQVNVIVLAATNVSGYDDVLRAAKAAGKLVILEDSRVDTDPSLYYTYVGSDFHAQGQKAAVAMCTALKDFKSKRVAEVSGSDGLQAEIDRAKGFGEIVGDCGIDIPQPFSAAEICQDPAPKANMECILRRHTTLQGVFAHTDEAAVGAIQAIKEAGLKPGKDVMVVGIDGTADGLKHLLSGELYADVDSTPLLGPLVYESALRGLNGDTSVPKSISPTEQVYTSASLPKCWPRCSSY